MSLPNEKSRTTSPLAELVDRLKYELPSMRYAHRDLLREAIAALTAKAAAPSPPADAAAQSAAKQDGDIPGAYVRDERGRWTLNGKAEPVIGWGRGWNACRDAMLNAKAAALAPDADEPCRRHECRRVRIEMQAEIERLRAVGVGEAVALPREILTALYERDGGKACGCINRSRKAELEYESGQCPHQRLAQYLAAPPATQGDALTAQERHVIEALLDLAYKAWRLADDSEDMGDSHNVEAVDFEALSRALDVLGTLPDDQPGYMMGEAAKARWALRRLIGTDAAIAAEDAPQGDQPAAGEALYYIQDTRQFVGNCPVWWAHGGSGYVTRLDEAGRFTFDEAIRTNRGRNTDISWPCAEIDALARLTVDHQHMRARHVRQAEIDAAIASIAAQAGNGGAS
ncbi:hypothetical protein [Pseudoxanthomonas sp. USHLN014]|uniref:hypothetical protein n=1 Tax=Pseudoxanthomonas sp. USHLN014 TaxID=3081297 RepID=UPI00301C70F5